MNLPKKVRIDSSSMCQLECPICETPKRKNNSSSIGWGYLGFEKFKKFLDDNPNIKEINLSWIGEMFLNPDLIKIIKHAGLVGVSLNGDGGTNLNNCSQDVLEYLVKYNFKSLRISIDGASSETYSIYRRKGNFRKVIGNIVKINNYKKKYKSIYPKLTWQFILFGHNEHELLKAKLFADKLGMSFSPKLSWDENYSPIKDFKSVQKYTGFDSFSRKDYVLNHGGDYMSDVCKQLWVEPVISWKGDLFGCCKNTKISFGNVFDTSFEDCFFSEEYQHAIRVVNGKEKPNESLVCRGCPVYKNIKNE